MDDDERAAKLIEKQIERANATAKEVKVVAATELKRESEEEKVTFAMSASSVKKVEKPRPVL